MPRRDGTGPMGAGPMTGRGMGLCNTNRTARLGGFGLGRGLGRGLGLRLGRGLWRSSYVSAPEDEKSMLMEQKKMLEDNLNQINKILSSDSKDK